MSLTVNKELWGVGVAWLDSETLAATIEFPKVFNDKQTGAALLINELYRVCSRKGAGIVYCYAKACFSELMASVDFRVVPCDSNSSDSVLFFRYSERYIETIAMKLNLSISIHATDRGDKQQARIHLLQAPWVRNMVAEVFNAEAKKESTLKSSDSVQSPDGLK